MKKPAMPSSGDFRAANARSLKEKIARGERLAKADRLHLWAEKVAAMDEVIAPLVQTGRHRAALNKVLTEIAAAFIGQAERNDMLEDRIAALEGRRASRAMRRAKAAAGTP